MLEIEIKARVKDFRPIKKKITEIGGEFINIEKQIDAIFGHPRFLDVNKMVVEGGLSARVRQKNDNKMVDFKEIKRNGIGMEFSAPTASVKMGKDFLEKLGFEEAFTIAKRRENYKYKDFTISLDDVEGLGKFIEIEHDLRKKEGSDEAIKECREFLKIIAPDAIIENKKYGDLMQELINTGR